MVADNLAERFEPPLWRFGNSGTESTMDAVHLMRAATGRDRILKVEGGYHGHHDSVMVSVLPEPDEDLGPADAPIGITDNGGIPDAITGLTTIVPFNDLEAVRRALETHPGEVAGHDRRADHDERGDHPSPTTATSRPSRTCSTSTAPCWPSTR